MKKLSIVGLIVLAFSFVFMAYHFLRQPTAQESKAEGYNLKTAQFKTKDDSQTLSKMVSKQAGVYFYGFPECPWCQELVPVLNKVLKAKKAQAYTVDVHGESYSDEDSQALKRFYQEHTKKASVSVPFVVFINDQGEVKTHVGTVDGHDAKTETMTTQQKQELEDTLTALVKWSQS